MELTPNVAESDGGGDDNSRSDSGPHAVADTELADTGVQLEESTGRSSGRSTGRSSGQPRFRAIDVGDTLGRYEIVEELGSGGMATVYLGRDTELRREVAVKVLFPHLCKRRETMARFQREARAAAGLDHPHIVRVYDVGGGLKEGATNPGTGDAGDTGAGDSIATVADGEDGNNDGQKDADNDPLYDPPYIVMELVRGTSLDHFLKAHERDQGGLPVGEVVACMGVIICSALTEAHKAGIVHRDIKPSNVMIADGGRLALADFGVARLEGDDSSLVTRSGALIGTPAFMSPEQAVGGELDNRSDIYSLGATLYKLATGAAPFHGPTARVVAAIARGDEYKPPLMRNPAMGPDLARVIKRMMAHDPDQRFQSCDEAARALRQLVADSGLGDPESELADFFDHPDSYPGERTATIAAATLERANRAAEERNLPRAMALADRVLALEPGSARADEAMALVEQLGAGRHLGKWFAVAAAIAIVGMVVVAVAAFWPSGDRPVAAVDAAPQTDAASVAVITAGSTDAAPSNSDNEPVDAAAADTGPDAGPMVARRPDVRRPPRTGNGRNRPRNGKNGENPGNGDNPGNGGSGGSDQNAVQTVDAGAERPPVEPVAPAPAIVTLDIRPWCDVFIDGKEYGRAQRGREISLAPGKRRIVCSQGKGRPEWKRIVDLEPGERLALRGSVLQPVRVGISLKKGDRVTIDKRTYRNGDSLELSPGRYRVAVSSGERKLTDSWISIPAIEACTLRDKPAVDCYR